MNADSERGSMNRTNDEAGILTPEQRRGEIARTLAAGVLRLHARAALAAAFGGQNDRKNPENSEPARLEVSSEVVLTVHSG
jgi:hypothetical protein